ncbi:preprotein translocase subunit SecG [Bdellovibrio sp. HCB337]|uniref:preprotein translocase subunit SecG n=1 Tax=Bdellovibrio sp. HCB337 TaxID=3394358 RepID=UPI0039A407B4
MGTFVAILHIVVALILIGLVLIQDSKGGGALGIGGGGGSNSVLGATGASTLAAKMTRIAAIIFALTSIGLTVLSSQQSKSVLDKLPAASAVPAAPTAPAAAPADATAPAAAPEAAAPAAPAEAPATK